MVITGIDVAVGVSVGLGVDVGVGEEVGIGVRVAVGVAVGLIAVPAWAVCVGVATEMVGVAVGCKGAVVADEVESD